MKTLGIFGCSFAADCFPSFPERSWVDFIRDTNLYEVTNFAKVGTSLWYSYDMFLKQHHKFDKIIVVTTTPHRLTVPEESSLSIYKHQHYNQICQRYEISVGVEKTQFKLLKDYFDMVHNFEKEENHHMLMTKHINDVRPDAIVYAGSSLDPDQFTLLNASIWESKMMGNDIIRTGKLTYSSRLHKIGMFDHRKCHLVEENNKVVSDMFLARLRGENAVIGFNDLIKPTKSFEYYLN